MLLNELQSDQRKRISDHYETFLHSLHRRQRNMMRRERRIVSHFWPWRAMTPRRAHQRSRHPLPPTR